MNEPRERGAAMSGGRILAGAASYGVMGLFGLMTLYPILWLLINSVKEKSEYLVNKLGLPAKLTFFNFQQAWTLGDFDKLILNSLLYTFGATFGTVILALMAGFALAAIRSKATPYVYNGFLVGILLTLQSIMIPLFILMSNIGLYNTRLGVLIPYIGIGLPMGVYLGTEYIRSIPMALVESARIDGAGYFRIFRAIILPMTVSVAITLSIMNVTANWNEFMLINVLASKTEIKSLPLGIFRFSGPRSSDYGTQFAALTIGMLPMLAFYLAFQKRIAQGVAAGAVKG
jgi:raffinose/stachyose/melibiose transport system permease protein